MILPDSPARDLHVFLKAALNGEGPVVRPVLFIDAEGVASDTRISSGETDTSEYRFDLSQFTEDNQVEVSARLLYRRAWRDTAVTKGWTTTPTGGPIEIEVANAGLTLPVAGVPAVVPVPVPHPKPVGHWCF